MVDKNLGVLEAFQESSRVTEGARWQILGLSIISWFINMVPLLALATLLAAVYAYRHQQENTLQLRLYRSSCWSILIRMQKKEH